jgi:NDP-sugar pyrophosphorylase family protein
MSTHTEQYRERLTITLKKDVLAQLDATIDGTKIRNRSHAIEYILGKHLNPGVKRALILAGGKGLNMRPFTYEIPKAMIPVHGRPILEYIIEQLRMSGVTDLVILVSHLGEKIKAHFRDGKAFDVRIRYVAEKEARGTGGSLRTAKPYLNETFLLIYGDVLADLDIHELVNFHQTHHGVVTAALSTAEDPTEYGLVKLRGHHVLDFIEKPKGSRPGLVSAGIYILEPTIFKYLKGSKISLESDVLPKLAQEGKVVGYPFEGQWFDVSTPIIYERALHEWRKNG